MSTQRNFLLVVAVMTVGTMPAMAQTTSAAGVAGSATVGARTGVIVTSAVVTAGTPGTLPLTSPWKISNSACGGTSAVGRSMGELPPPISSAQPWRSQQGSSP